MESPVQRLRVKKKTRAWILGRVIIKPYSPPLGAKDRVVKRETKQHGHTGRRRAQRPALSPIHQGGEADGEHSDQLSLPFTSEVRQTASRATSPLSLSPVRWGRRRAQRPALSLSLSLYPVRWSRRRAQRPAFTPFHWSGEANGLHSDQLSLPFPSEVRHIASTATSSHSFSPVRWGRRRTQRPALSPIHHWVRQTASTANSSHSLSPVRWGR